ncbi:esterase [Roseibium aquae]|uniref:Esterase n=1 Tax=Roseibium aquae TaxID=1323746 RepID=A0A916T6I8_9HYPH|nr:alpha/beta hydrolase [Roseibium aquae]GGB32368.1 esterase [Roseibium aquae]
MLSTILVAIITPLICLAGYTAFRTREISRRHRADGSFAEIYGTRLHYHMLSATKHPDRPFLVFIHGASGNAHDQMLAFKERFAGEFPLLFVDRPGLGFSDRDMAGHASPKAQAELIGGLLRHLQIEAAVVVGHSLGAAIAAALALEEPDRVKRLVFLAPATHPWPGGVHWYYSVAAMPVIGSLFCWTLTLPVGERLVPRSLANVFQPAAPPAGYARTIRLSLLFRPKSFRANAMDIALLKPHLVNQSKRYGEITQPAVIVTGTQDTVVWPSIHSKGLESDLPNARLVVLDGAGHMPHLTHGAEIEAEIRAVCDGVSVDAPGLLRDADVGYPNEDEDEAAVGRAFVGA